MVIESSMGDKHGRWTVVGPIRKLGSHYAYECRCECGTIRVVRSYQLRSGKSLSCGCYAAEASARRNSTHGMTDTPEFMTWRSMIKRCYEVGRRDSDRYIGRGIAVCDRWLGPDGFANFYKDMGARPKDHTLDRIDNDKGYSPNNCRWATSKEQANNRSSNFCIEYEGTRYTAKQLGHKLGIHPDTLRWRMKNWGNITAKKGSI